MIADSESREAIDYDSTLKRIMGINIDGAMRCWKSSL